MLPIRTILHPTDFSECSDAALSVAKLLAREQGARLLLLHVAPVVVPMGEMVPLPAAPKALLAALEDRRARCDALSRYPVEVLLREGDPVEEIVRLAAEREADVIVMGSHGRSGFVRWLLGSVAEGVMRKAHCPVLTVKTPLAVYPVIEYREKPAKRGAPRYIPATPATEGVAEQARVIVEMCEGNCRGLPLTRVHHGTFPEIWAEGDSVSAAIAQLVGKLISARETCGSQWHRDMLAQAITDVRTYNPAPAARRSQFGERGKSRQATSVPTAAKPG